MRGKDSANGFRCCEGPKVIHQRLALLRKTHFHKIEKNFLILKFQFGAFAREAKCYQCGADFRRRTESTARNVKYKFRPSIELRGNGEIPVLLGLWFCSETQSDFLLDHDMNFIDLIRERKEMMQDRRGDVVGQVSIHPDAPASCEAGEIGLQNVAGNDSDVRAFFRETPETRLEQRIQLDGIDWRASAREVLGHLPVAGADFYPAVRWIWRNLKSRG